MNADNAVFQYTFNIHGGTMNTTQRASEGPRHSQTDPIFQGILNSLCPAQEDDWHDDEWAADMDRQEAEWMKRQDEEAECRAERLLTGGIE